MTQNMDKIEELEFIVFWQKEQTYTEFLKIVSRILTRKKLVFC